MADLEGIKESLIKGDANWWEKEPLRLVHIFYMSSEVVKKFNAREYADWVKKLNANAVHFEATYCSALARYNSKLMAKEPVLGSRDLLKEVIPALHRRGIRIFVYIILHPVHRRDIQKHPDWLEIDSKGDRVRCYNSLYAGCINSSWGKYHYDIIREIVENYEVDGIFLDGPAFFENACYCGSCQKRFKEKFGEKIPDGKDKDDPLYKEFITWRYDCIKEYVKGAGELIHSIKPDVAFYTNGIQGLHRFSRLSARDAQQVAKVEDIAGTEAFVTFHSQQINRPLWLPGANAKFMNAVSSGKPSVIFTTYGSSPHYLSALTKASLRYNILQSFANGAGVWLEMAQPVLDYSPEEAKVVSETYGFIKKHQDYYQAAKSIAKVALLWSRQSGDYYGALPEDVNVGQDFISKEWQEIGDPSRIYLTGFFGIYDALVRAHIPFDIIVDEDLNSLEKLKRYTVLVLANTPCLSGKQNKNIKEFVVDGGGLFASYESSLYDEKGNRRKIFALADLLGIQRLKKRLGPLEDSYIFHQEGFCPFLKGIRRLSPSPRYNLSLEARNNKQVKAYLMDNTHFDAFEEPACKQLVEKKIKKEHPFLLVNECKKGRVVYTSGSLGDRYWWRTPPEIKELIRNVVNWLSKESSLITLSNAPETVEVVLTRQGKKKRHLLHLINFTGEMSRPMEEVIPLDNIHLSLNQTELPKFRKITLLSNQQKIKLQRRKNRINFTIPKLNDYEIVVLE